MPELWNKLGELGEGFSPKECRNYFKHAGYYRKIKPRPTPNTI